MLSQCESLTPERRVTKASHRGKIGIVSPKYSTDVAHSGIHKSLNSTYPQRTIRCDGVFYEYRYGNALECLCQLVNGKRIGNASGS